MLNVKIQKLVEVDPKEPEFYLPDFMPIPKSATTFISAVGGTGKTFLAIQLAARAVQKNNTVKALVWFSEDPAGLIKHRAEAVLNKIKSAGLNHLNNIDIIDDFPEPITKANAAEYQELFAPYNIVFLDPLIAFFGGEENSNSQARQFMGKVNQIAIQNLQSIVFLHHGTKPTKEQESRARGAGAFVDAVRLAYEIKDIEGEPANKEIIITKDNYGVKRIFGESQKIQVLPAWEEKKKTPKEVKADLIIEAEKTKKELKTEDDYPLLEDETIAKEDPFQSVWEDAEELKNEF